MLLMGSGDCYWRKLEEKTVNMYINSFWRESADYRNSFNERGLNELNLSNLLFQIIIILFLLNLLINLLFNVHY